MQLVHPICAMLEPQLKKHINEIYEGKTRVAADAIGVNNTFLWRLINGKQKNIGFFNAIRIYEDLGLEDDSLLREYFPKDYSNYGSALRTRRDANVVERLRYAYSSSNRSEVYCFVWSTGKRTVKDLTEEFGRRGALILEDFIDSNIVKILEDGTLQSLLASATYCDASTAKMISLKHIESTDLDIPGTISRSFCYGLTKEAVDKLIHKLEKTVFECDEFEKDPINQGPISFVGTVTAGPMAHSMERQS